MTVQPTHLFGIPNCDSVRTARRWLDDHKIPYQFHDLRKDVLDTRLLASWLKQAGWETLLNRRGTTWRHLPADVRKGINAQRAQMLMLEQPTLIKRPVLATGPHLEVGFDSDRYLSLFKG